MSATPKETALHPVHAELGAKFTDFGGWDMPLKYGKELEEHRAVREAVGVFDLSHMGEVLVTGPDAAAFLDHALISRISAVKVGKAKYSMICREDGGIIDDLITYVLTGPDGSTEYLVIPNAGNAPAVFAALTERAGDFNVTLVDRTEDISLIAVQGPKAAAVMLEIVDAVTDAPEASGAGTSVEAAIAGLGYYAAFQGTVAGVPAIIARTGYTGEDGFEIFVDNEATGVPGEAPAKVWAAALTAGEPYGVLPCGLAARDTLRLEAGMPLYGNELSLELTPVDAGLGILAATKSKDEFVGRDAIVAAKEQGTKQRLIGLVGEGKRAARGGYEIQDASGARIGEVTSGALSPTLGHPVAMGYVAADADVAEGSAVTIDIRGKAFPYTVVALPFYSREK
ncbi:glycine cleavage system aminomethyltransferase GcvT [Corynebacterium terpenotabidum]|uniref:Aminomethyltransferase n=1 Tax=Corynebacterium terpenotabidum Y-11 TaxID=1200352 RepID=S4XH43_9CORY|nr:glycine cleavage system aminomethyltransferase GcvT [Corynebacterium terpenotabidum]AGP29953.1 glycine cleavage system aminomethyltransferase T [Corynebacterium terpenotabidum Y-11]